MGICKDRRNRLILELQEGITEKEDSADTSPCDLIADKEGIITDMIVRCGVPVKNPGDVCKKGELLVSGELHIMNDNQEIVRNEYVHADADIFISRQISYYQEFSMKHPVEKPAGKIKRGLYFRIGEWYLGLYGPVVQSQRCVTEEEPLHIHRSFPPFLRLADLSAFVSFHNHHTPERSAVPADDGQRLCW